MEGGRQDSVEGEEGGCRAHGFRLPWICQPRDGESMMAMFSVHPFHTLGCLQEWGSSRGKELKVPGSQSWEELAWEEGPGPLS